MSECVPLAVLLQVDGRWVVDTWTARRDIGAGSAEDTWRSRLGMRPWNVFMAQVLQFQDQLNALVPDLALFHAVQKEVVDPRDTLARELIAEFETRGGQSGAIVHKFGRDYLGDATSHTCLLT